MATPFRVSKLEFSPTPDPSWKDVVYASSIGVFVALDPSGGDSADKVLRSDDGGETWTYEDLPAAAPWNSLVWSEDAGLFAAFCTNNSGISVATSPDGITWTNRHAESATIRSCAYGQSKFVGVGGLTRRSSAHIISKSNFALQANGVATRTVNINMGVTTSMFVGLVGATNDYIDGGGASVKFDGVSMTLLQKVQVSGDRWIYMYHLENPAVGGTKALVVTFNTTNNGTTVTNVGCSIHIMGYSSAGAVSSSTTDTGSGTSISTSRTTVEDAEWLIQFSCNAADSTATAGTGATIRTTTDGQGGTMADSNSGLTGLTPPGSHSLAVNVTSSNWAAITAAFAPSHVDGFIESSDGITWTESFKWNDTVQGVCYSPDLDMFCAICAGGGNGGGLGDTYNILTSSDGSTWTFQDLGTSTGAGLTHTGSSVIVWADDLGLFVVVLEDGTVRTSPDGVTWSEMTLPVAANIPAVLGVTWAKRLGLIILFTEADSSGLKPLLYSEDGVTAVAEDTLSTDDFNGDWHCGAYSGDYDKLIVFPAFTPYAMLVEFGPTIIEVVPPSGDIVGGNTVQIIGKGFLPGIEVVFDNKFATDVVVISETLLTCVVPEGDELGFVDVTVTNTDDRFDIGEDLYEYATDISGDSEGGSGEEPQIGVDGEGCVPGSIVPATGPITGGTPVTINGRGFKAGSVVLFDGIPATSVFVDAVQPWPALVTAKNPEAWWRLEEESEDLVLADSTVNGHDATLGFATGKTSVPGGLSSDTSRGIALEGKSMGFSFDGTQGIAAFTALTVLSGACTIEFLLKPSGISGYGTIIGAQVDQDGIYFYNDGQNWISYESATDGYTDQLNSTPLVTGQTYHIALVLDGVGGGQWFIDGVADATVSNVNLGGLLDCLFDTGGFPLQTDLIDEIAVYDTALSGSTLLSHATNLDANYPVNVIADGAIAYWRCGEQNSETTIVDSTGNGYDALLATGGRNSVSGALDDGHDIATVSPTLPLTGPYSIEFLINPRATGEFQTILSDATGNGSVYLNNTDMLLVIEVGGSHFVISTVAPVEGQISHCIFTCDGANGKWYLNGVDVTDTGSGTTWNGADDFVIEKMLGDVTGDPVVCDLLDELVVYLGTTLTPAEVLARYEAARLWVSGTYITAVTPPHTSGEVDVEVLEEAEVEVGTIDNPLEASLHTAEPIDNQSDNEIIYTGYSRVDVSRSGWKAIGTKIYPPTDIIFGKKTDGPGGVVKWVAFGTNDVIERKFPLSVFLNVRRNGVIPRIQSEE